MLILHHAIYIQAKGPKYGL